MIFDLPVRLEDLKKLSDSDEPEGTHYCQISAKCLYKILTEQEPNSILRDFSKPEVD